MKIGILSPWDMKDPRAWSGVIAPMVESLGKQADVICLQVPAVGDSLIDRALTKFLGTLGYTYLPQDAFATTVRKALAVHKLLKDNMPDMVISLAASKESLGVPRGIPVVQVTDSSFLSMIDGYFQNEKISKISLIQGILLDRLVAKKSDYYCVASEWSAQQLIRDAKVNPGKIEVIPFGPGVSPPDGFKRNSLRSSEGLSVLFIGSHWFRKGGDRALAIFQKVSQYRNDISMTIVGASHEGHQDGIVYFSKISKSELSSLYLSHDLLLEPTRASAGGVVVTDALNHGLPVVATNIGGIPTLVKDGVTGWLVSDEGAVENTADLLTSLTKDQVEEASKAAIKDSAERLAWTAWAKNILRVCAGLASSRKQKRDK